MSLSANTAWEVRASTGSDSNGGGFVAGASGTDYSQQNAAQYSFTDLASTTGTSSTPAVTSASHSFVAADVGNLIQVTAGTNWTAGFYQVVSVSAGAATLDRACGSSATLSGGTWAEGGALATLGKVAVVGSNKVFATGNFTTTATIAFSVAVSSPSNSAPPTLFAGYGSARGDGGRATITLSTNTGLIGLSFTGAGVIVDGFIVDCASLGTSTGIKCAGGNSRVQNCLAKNFTSVGIFFSSSGVVFNNEVTGGTSAAAFALELNSGTVAAIENWVHDNATTGIQVGGAGCTVSNNLVANNSGASSIGITVSTACSVLSNTIHNNGNNGIQINTTFNLNPVVRGNLITSNGGYGLSANNSPGNPASLISDGNVYWNNTSGARRNADDTGTGAAINGVSPYTNVFDVNLSASPYVGPTTGSSANFALNTAAGGGAAARSKGFAASWPGNSGSVGYPDPGAVQSKGSTVSPPIVANTFSLIG